MAAAATEGTWWQALLCQAFCHMETLLPLSSVLVEWSYRTVWISHITLCPVHPFLTMV